MINSEEDIPAYIYIDSISVQTDYTTQGSNSKNTPDAWVFVNDQFVGGYELPKLFPVFKQKETDNIKVKAGIKNSGAAALRVDYPFYKYYEADVELSKNRIDTIRPTVQYFNDLTFALIEDFEQLTSTFETTNESVPLEITQQPEEVFEGMGSAKISLPSQEAFFYSISDAFTLPKLGIPVYLELDYKSDVFIEIRLITNLPGDVDESSIIVLYPKADYNKIYIDLEPNISQFSTAVSHRIAILSYTGTDLTSGTTYLDNIKLIHPNF